MRMTFRLIIIGGLVVFFAVVSVVVFVPTIVWNPPQTLIAQEYAGLEAEGRRLFYSNGCNYCHTQYVRLEDTAMGAVSEGGNYVFDNPMILGSERTGPDLSYVGRKRGEAWEIAHLKSPRDFSPNSIMPKFDFLADAQLQAIAAYLFSLGDRVAQSRMITPPAPYAGKVSPLKFPTVLPGGETPHGWPDWTASGLQEGKEIYMQRCQTCHGCSGNGLGTYAGTLSVTPADYKQEPFRSMPDDQFFWHVSEGLPGTVMPTWRLQLSEDQRWKVIAYIKQAFSKPVMRDPNEGDLPAEYANLVNPVPLTLETLDRGKQIFTRECLVCHGDSGRGNGPYGDGLQPSPPDFSDSSLYGTLANPSYLDADYFWRISEGLPWSAMPVWKSQYSEEDRWSVVHYIRSVFTQTETPPQLLPDGEDFNFPDIFKTQTVPGTASYARGRLVYLNNCAQCHGLAGDGKGWDGQYLNPTPRNLQEDAGTPLAEGDEGMALARVTFGIKGTAMPSWGEFLPVDQRWDAIKYLIDSFRLGRPANASVAGNGDVATGFSTLSPDNWKAEGHEISLTRGADVYTVYCATCHGSSGQGDGPGSTKSPSGGPAPLPADVSVNYLFWRVWDGVPESVMPPFARFLSDSDVWDVVMYTQQLLPAVPGSPAGAAQAVP
jgi:mono/diheme cytochrome c family protein